MHLERGNTSSTNITDKELLAFLNLVKLDWQFANYFDSLTNKNDTIYNLLSKPENFKRTDIFYDENGNPTKTVVKLVYGETGKDGKSELDEKLAYQEMQRVAGLGMQYYDLSHRSSQEGYFLQEWEVIDLGSRY